MAALDKDYIVVVQCEIVKERCSGYFCEKAFHERADGFAAYDKGKDYRILYMTCGGCCGKAVQRKLTHLARKIKKNEGVEKGRIVVQLASCMTKDNFHSPPCPHLGLIKEIIARAGLDVREDTHTSPKAEQRRASGQYKRNV
jgi:predicted metal-binding protein